MPLSGPWLRYVPCYPFLTNHIAFYPSGSPRQVASVIPVRSEAEARGDCVTCPKLTRQDLNPVCPALEYVPSVTLPSPSWQCDEEDGRAEAGRARLWKEHLGKNPQHLGFCCFLGESPAWAQVAALFGRKRRVTHFHHGCFNHLCLIAQLSYR